MSLSQVHFSYYHFLSPSPMIKARNNERMYRERDGQLREGGRAEGRGGANDS